MFFSFWTRKIEIFVTKKKVKTYTKKIKKGLGVEKCVKEVMAKYPVPVRNPFIVEGVYWERKLKINANRRTKCKMKRFWSPFICFLRFCFCFCNKICCTNWIWKKHKQNLKKQLKRLQIRFILHNDRFILHFVERTF